MSPTLQGEKQEFRGIKKSIQGLTAFKYKSQNYNLGLDDAKAHILSHFPASLKFNRLVFIMSKALQSLSAWPRPDHLSSQTAFHIPLGYHFSGKPGHVQCSKHTPALSYLMASASLLLPSTPHLSSPLHLQKSYSLQNTQASANSPLKLPRSRSPTAGNICSYPL